MFRLKALNISAWGIAPRFHEGEKICSHTMTQSHRMTVLGQNPLYLNQFSRKHTNSSILSFINNCML